MKLVHILSVATLCFHSLVAASGKLSDLIMKLGDFSGTWTGVNEHFATLAISTVSSTDLSKVPKGSVVLKGLLEIFSASSNSRADTSPNL